MPESVQRPRIGFRVNRWRRPAGYPLADAQEAGALLKRFSGPDG